RIAALLGASAAEGLVEQRVTGRSPRGKTRRDADLLDLPAQSVLPLAVSGEMPKGELQARRAGVDPEDRGGRHMRSRACAVPPAGQTQSRISGMSSPWWRTYSPCSISLSRRCCVTCAARDGNPGTRASASMA